VLSSTLDRKPTGILFVKPVRDGRIQQFMNVAKSRDSDEPGIDLAATRNGVPPLTTKPVPDHPPVLARSPWVCLDAKETDRSHWKVCYTERPSGRIPLAKGRIGRFLWRFEKKRGFRILGSKGRKNREGIVRLAAPLFNRQGFAGTSMSDLMKATKLQKGGSIAISRARKPWPRSLRLPPGNSSQRKADGLDRVAGAIPR